MSFWRILKCIFRLMVSSDLRLHKDDVYDEQGNVFILGPWLDQAMNIFTFVIVILLIIVFPLSWLYFVDLPAFEWIRWILISFMVILPPLLSAVYVAIKRAVFLKKQKQQKGD